MTEQQCCVVAVFLRIVLAFVSLYREITISSKIFELMLRGVLCGVQLGW